jgi:hypothetical protein
MTRTQGRIGKTKPQAPARAAEIVRDPGAGPRRRLGPRLVGTKLPSPEHWESTPPPAVDFARRHSTRQ